MSKQAQDLIRCSTCDNYVSISCRSCRLDFCKDCIGDHVSETLAEHDIVLFEDKFTSEIVLPECDHHRNQNCTLVCKVCDVPICTTCFTKNHRKHNVQDLVEAVNQKHAEIKNDLSRISHFISHYRGIRSDIERKVEEVGKNCDSLTSQIESDGLTLQDNIQQNVERSKEDILNYEKDTQELLRSFELNVNSRTDLLLHKMKEKEMLLQQNVAHEIMGYKSDSYLTEIPPSLDIKQVKLEIEETGEHVLLGSIMNDIQKYDIGNNVVLQADEDFEGYGEGYLGFNKNDALLVDRKTDSVKLILKRAHHAPCVDGNFPVANIMANFNNTTSTLVMGIHLSNGRFGYIPKSHVAIRQLRRRCNQLQRWWMPIGKESVKEVFMNDKIQNGTFCISDYEEHSYNISIKCDSSVTNISVAKLDDTVSVQGTTDTFTSLTALIQFYQEERESFPCQLLTPVHHQLPTKGFEGLNVLRDQIDIISETPLERLSKFDMFKGRCNTKFDTTIRVYKLLELTDDMVLSTFDANAVVQEADNMRQLSHENVLQFVALSTASYPLVMITEFVRQSLLQYLKTEPHWQHISLQTIVNFAAQISNGMDYCHRKKFIHMNLCTQNIFMDENLVVKIGGLHTAKRVDVEPFQMAEKTRPMTQWASPEILLSNTYGKKSDVWSFGVLLYEMITFGRVPFPDAHFDKLCLFSDAQTEMLEIRNMKVKVIDVVPKDWGQKLRRIRAMPEGDNVKANITNSDKSRKTDMDIHSLYEARIRLPQPTDCRLECPDSFYHIMESCCDYEATCRPSFEELTDIFMTYFNSQRKITNRVHCKSDSHGVPQLQEWWNIVGKNNATKILMQRKVQLGAFFISEATGYSFTLSVKTLDIWKSPTVKHFTIFKVDDTEVCINKDKTYPSLNDLIEYHKCIKGELKCLLGDACRESASHITYNGDELVRNSIASLQPMGSSGIVNMYKGENEKDEKITVFTFKEIPDKRKWTEDAFLEAANVMQGFSHDNLLRIIGCCSMSKPIFMVTEPITWMLLHILQLDKGQSLEFHNLIDISSQIAGGMDYLSAKNYIHRDLRAMNVFLTQNFEVKIGGLFLCSEIKDISVSAEMWSVRWSAPEIFDGECFLKSDVWSFGVLLYELITFGLQPYYGMLNDELRRRIKEGYRIPKPLDGPIECPEYYYRIMMDCWDSKPEKRPSFKTLHNVLKNYFVHDT